VALAYDEEDRSYMTDPNFWRMIEERRRETSYVTLEQVKLELDDEIRRMGQGELEKASHKNTLNRNNKGKPHGSA